MGFTKPPGQLYDKLLFINNCQGYPWSWPDNIPCQEAALEGKPIGLMVRTSEYKGDVSEKLLFLLKDENFTYCIRCGLETNFSRGLLLGLQACLAEQSDDSGAGTANRLIIVAPKLSERDQKVIFCNLWADNQRVKVEWNKEISLYSLARSLAEKYFPNIPFEKGNEADVSSSVSEMNAVEDDSGSSIFSRIRKKLDERSAKVEADNDSGEVDFQSLLVQNNSDLKALGIDTEKARQMLVSRYGKKSRSLLTDKELIDFVVFCSRLKSPTSPLVNDDCPF
ncbi:MAG: hypothetical protein GPJ00_01090 [Microcystis aeruginosa W13-18]|nr:hypothetical protein [Microcystis aeruginosa W13-18]NCR34958.1 hypothetical protein [Microcystis aeruginosa S11-05]NCR48437.1 hypothetical protein [Microcystis aeruginosa S11-01]